MYYPYCVIEDVQARIQHQKDFSATTRPTSTEVAAFIEQYASKLRGILKDIGYDIDNLFSVSSTIAAEMISTDNFDVLTGDGSDFTVGATIKIEGTLDGIKTWEFTTITAITGDNIRVDTQLDYDAGATVKEVNDALRVLQEINSIGAAYETAKVKYGGIAPNDSTDLIENLLSEYKGSEETCDGIWGLKNVPGFLNDAVVADPWVRAAPQSYGSNNKNDEDVQPEFTKSMDL